MARRIKGSLVFDIGDVVRISDDISDTNAAPFLEWLRCLKHSLRVIKVFENDGLYLYHCVDKTTGRIIMHVNEDNEPIPFSFTTADLRIVVVHHPVPIIPRIGDIVNIKEGILKGFDPLEKFKVIKVTYNPSAILDSKKYEVTCCLASDDEVVIAFPFSPDNIFIISTPQESLQPTAGEHAVIKYDMESYTKYGYFYHNRMKMFVGRDVIISEASIMSGELVYKCIDACTSLPILFGPITVGMEEEFSVSEISLCNNDKFNKDKTKEINHEQQKSKDENNSSEISDEMSELISSIADVFDTPPIIVKLSKTESGELNFEEVNISKDNQLTDEVECNCPRCVSKKENGKTTKKEVKDDSKLAELLLGKSEIKNIVEKLDKHINLYDLSSIFNEGRLVKEVYVRTPSTTKTQMLEVKIAVYKTEDIVEDLRVLNEYAEQRFKEAKQPFDSTLIQRNVKIANKILAKMVEDNKEYNPNLEYEIGGIDFTSHNLSAGIKLDLNDNYFGIVIATDNL